MRAALVMIAACIAQAQTAQPQNPQPQNPQPQNPQPMLLDRIAVTVDKQIIAESDIIRFLRVGAFLDGKPLDLSPSARRTAAEDLVDQLLMNIEAADSHINLNSAEDLGPALMQVKAQYPDDGAYQAALRKYGITEQELENHLVAGIHALRFADLRFRPEVQIPDQELRAAYDKFASQWRATHTQPPASLDDSRESLETLLTGQRTTQLLDQWLETERKERHVDYREAAFQ